MVGEIVHIEIPSGDFTRSADFYGKLFGWKADGAQSGGHLLFDLPGGTRGSWIRGALAQAPGPVPFVSVADVESTLAEAERNGGRVLVRRLQLANRGFFGLIADCDGNVIGVLEGATGDVSAKKTEAVAPAAAASSSAAKSKVLAPVAAAKPPAAAPAATKPAPKPAAKTSAAAKPAEKTAAKPAPKSAAKPPARKR